MSNKPRIVVPKKNLKIQISKLYLSLRESDEKLRIANERLEAIEEPYIRYKREVKSIVSKNLFRGLYAAFRLWEGERR